MRLKTLLAASLLCAAPLAAQQAPASGTVAIRAARIIDGTGAAPIQNGIVVITEDRIVAVGPASQRLSPCSKSSMRRFSSDASNAFRASRNSRKFSIFQSAGSDGIH